MLVDFGSLLNWPLSLCQTGHCEPKSSFGVDASFYIHNIDDYMLKAINAITRMNFFSAVQYDGEKFVGLELSLCASKL